MLGGMSCVGCADASRYIVEGISTKQRRHRREAGKASERSTKAPQVCKASERGLEVISSPPKFLAEPSGKAERGGEKDTLRAENL